MLLEVELRDFAIVRQVRVELTGGFCVLTGETGAGKSIVIDAIGLLLGARASAEWVRAGASSCRLRAIFDLSDVPGAVALLADLGLDPDPDGICPLTREISADGRSRCTINGATATVAMLRTLGERLLDLHGQHDHQSLLQAGAHRAWLDKSGGEAVAEALAAYHETYADWRARQSAIAQLGRDDRDQARRLELLQEQVQELEAAALQVGEDAELASERARLSHAERLLEAADRAHRALAAAEDGPSTIDQVAAAADSLVEMAAVDEALRPLAEELGGALVVLTEAARAVAGYAESIDLDPQRLDAVETRLALLDKLRRKYGQTVEAMLQYADQAQAELEAMEHSDEVLSRLQAECEAVETELRQRASALTAVRSVAAGALQAAVQRHLADLGMASARFSIRLAPRDDALAEDDTEPAMLGPDGADAVEFLFSANPGEPPRPLARIGSGGEISRVMLALKSTMAESDGVPTMIFDEIDVGIGGVTIHAVGEKMKAIAAHRQVICITHHAPIAALADCHIAIEKRAGDDGTALSITRLEGEARVYEIARMLGRRPPTEATLAMARELLAAPGD